MLRDEPVSMRVVIPSKCAHWAFGEGVVIRILARNRERSFYQPLPVVNKGIASSSCDLSIVAVPT